MKKFMTIIGMLTCVFAINTCQVHAAAESTPLEYNESELQSRVDFMVNSVFNTFTDEQTAQFNGAEPEAIESLFNDQVGIAIDGKAFISGLESWNIAKKEMGDLVQIGDYTITSDNKEISVKADLVGTKRNAVMTVNFDKDFKITSLATDVKHSFGEKMEKAALNTIMGMGTVFLILILISFIISAMKIIPSLQKKFNNKSINNKKEEATENIIAQIIEKEELVDDLELVAVISAAIAAYTGSSTNGFQVRSIRRANTSKWKKS